MIDREIGVSQELLQEILDYLQQRPFHEVHVLIRKLLEEAKQEDK